MFVFVDRLPLQLYDEAVNKKMEEEIRRLPFMTKKLLFFSVFVLMFQVGTGNYNVKSQSTNKDATRQRVASEKKSNANQNTSDEDDDKTGTKKLFYEVLNVTLSKRGMSIEDVCNRKDSVARRIIEDYGAMFMASEKVHIPPACMFTSEKEVKAFQSQAESKSAHVGGITIELQTAAMDALLSAREEARQAGLNITPRGGDSARRSFSDTSKLWDSRFQPALRYWKAKGKLSADDVIRLRSLPIKEQVREVLELEKRGIFFSTNFSKSILYSVAAPGTSQHLSMLALDVREFGNSRVREILARHGWFQTVKSDQPHFTYLGVEEAKLPSLGLRSVKFGGQVFWIPSVN